MEIALPVYRRNLERFVAMRHLITLALWAALLVALAR